MFYTNSINRALKARKSPILSYDTISINRKEPESLSYVSVKPQTLNDCGSWGDDRCYSVNSRNAHEVALRIDIRISKAQQIEKLPLQLYLG